jgi:hypothetical protein
MEQLRYLVLFCALPLVISCHGTSPLKQVPAGTGAGAETPTPLTIVASGLVIQLDAGRASVGAFPGVGCSILTWADLSPNAVTNSLVNFTGCGASSGWTGSGTTLAPYALTFDGVDDYVDSSLTYAVTSFTIQMWVKPAVNATEMHLFSNGDSAGFTGSIDLQVYSDNQLRTVIQDGVGADTYGSTSLTLLPVATWTNLAVTFDNAAHIATYYQNGVPIESVLAGTKVPNASPAFTYKVGASGDLQHFLNGAISTVQFYNRTLTAAEVNQNCRYDQADFSAARICLASH